MLRLGVRKPIKRPVGREIRLVIRLKPCEISSYYKQAVQKQNYSIIVNLLYIRVFLICPFDHMTFWDGRIFSNISMVKQT